MYQYMPHISTEFTITLINHYVCLRNERLFKLLLNKQYVRKQRSWIIFKFYYYKYFKCTAITLYQFQIWFYFSVSPLFYDFCFSGMDSNNILFIIFTRSRQKLRAKIKWLNQMILKVIPDHWTPWEKEGLETNNL